MAKVTIPDDFYKFVSDMKQLEMNVNDICEKAVYEGAGYLASKVKSALSDLPTESHTNGKPPYAVDRQLSSISSTQKKDLINSFGITPVRNDNGFIHHKIGFDGYGSYRTRSYPQGIPNQLLARSLEKGTSFLKKNPVITRTVKAEKENTIKTMETKIKKEIERKLK